MANNRSTQPKPAATLVVGGGIGGMRAALDLANSGLKVYLVEHTPCLGGRTRPSISPAYVQHNQHPNIEIMTNTHVVDVEGQAGDFTVSLRHEPRYVDSARCINCDYCAQVCPVELPDAYQRGMLLRKAVYKVASRAAPNTYVIDRGPYCDDCGRCVEVCPTKAIDLNEQPRLLSVNVGAIILALGFKVYDASGMEELGYGRFANVVDAMQYERLASRSGPTEGVITRPSDNEKPRSVAWLQCIGSRDSSAASLQDNSFCSSICCMYATKEAMLAKQRLGGDVDCTIFMMEQRAFNKGYYSYFTKARDNHDISYVHCRVSAISEDPASGDLILHYAQPDGQLKQERFEMVVLATGLQPPDSARHFTNMLDLELNEHGFCKTDKFTPLQTTQSGVFVCGAFASPKEISETILDASGAAAEVMRLLHEQLNTHPYSHEYPFLATDTLPPERDVTNESPRVAVFACTCGDTMSKTLDLIQLVQHATQWPGVAVAELVDLACFPETLIHIQRRIRLHGINRVVIAGCSNRTHESLFQRTVRLAGLNPYMMELVNLRDQCSAVHVRQHELANRKAVELVRMAVGRVIAAKPIHKQAGTCQGTALIIGAGLAGMTAALAIADSDYDVILVERKGRFGGHLQDMYYVAEGDNPRRLGRDLVNRVQAHSRIHSYTYTEVIAHEGHVGSFWADLRTTRPDGSTDTFRVEHGVTIVATGGRENRDHPWLDLSGVITQEDLEETVVHRPEEIAALRNVVMIQCAQAPGHAEYCSRVCCTNTMKNAIRLKLFNPNCRVTVLYKNIVTYGFREKYYTEARRLGVIFLRYTDDEPPEIVVKPAGDQTGRNQSGGTVNHLSVRVRDLSLDRWLSLPADIIPLSVAITPAEGARELADLAAAARALTLLSQGTMYHGGVIAEVDADKCVGCLTCTRVCPFAIPQILQVTGRNGVGNLGGAAFIDPAQCHGCGTCTSECPAEAIQLTNYTDEQVMLREIGGLGRWRN
jgi:heterodisulfide reductase subunit A